MRRASFVAPLLLIGIGVIFLIRNIYPNVPFMEYAARFWPWVLIAWGGLRLVEIISWKAQERPLPARGISGGEWLLIAFICLFGSAVHAAHGFSTDGWPSQIRVDGMDLFGEPFEYPVTVEKPSSPAPHVLLENFRGDVRVTGGEAPLVKISGRRIVRTMQREEADRVNTASEIEITGDANNLVVHPRAQSSFEARRVTYNLEVTVPKGARVEIHGQNGDLNAEALSGIVMTSDRGDVRVRNISGPSQITLRRGDVHLEAAAVAGQLEISSGDVDASDITGPVKIAARSGDIKVEKLKGALDVNVTRGDLSLRPGQLSGPIHAHSRSGDISLALPSTTQFTMDASTGNGDVSSDFAEIKPETTGRRGGIHGSVGKGPTVELRTDRGDLSLRKATASSTPAKTPDKPLEKTDQ